MRYNAKIVQDKPELKAENGVFEDGKKYDKGYLAVSKVAHE
jgi:hypothetical protein